MYLFMLIFSTQSKYDEQSLPTIAYYKVPSYEITHHTQTVSTTIKDQENIEKRSLVPLLKQGSFLGNTRIKEQQAFNILKDGAKHNLTKVVRIFIHGSPGKYFGGTDDIYFVGKK